MVSILGNALAFTNRKEGRGKISCRRESRGSTFKCSSSTNCIAIKKLQLLGRGWNRFSKHYVYWSTVLKRNDIHPECKGNITNRGTGKNQAWYLVLKKMLPVGYIKRGAARGRKTLKSEHAKKISWLLPLSPVALGGLWGFWKTHRRPEFWHRGFFPNSNGKRGGEVMSAKSTGNQQKKSSDHAVMGTAGRGVRGDEDALGRYGAMATKRAGPEATLRKGGRPTKGDRKKTHQLF